MAPRLETPTRMLRSGEPQTEEEEAMVGGVGGTRDHTRPMEEEEAEMVVETPIPTPSTGERRTGAAAYGIG